MIKIKFTTEKENNFKFTFQVILARLNKKYKNNTKFNEMGIALDEACPKKSSSSNTLVKGSSIKYC
jgi:hypothetical protein